LRRIAEASFPVNTLNKSSESFMVVSI
jgi:hypothetical protein